MCLWDRSAREASRDASSHHALSVEALLPTVPKHKLPSTEPVILMEACPHDLVHPNPKP